MTQEERDNLLLDLKKGQEDRDKILQDLKKGQEELFIGQEDRDKILQDLKKGQEDLKEELKETNLEVRKISKTVAKIEYEHGNKIQILLEMVTSHIKKFDSVDNTLDSHKDRLDQHDNEIYCLNSKVQAF